MPFYRWLNGVPHHTTITSAGTNTTITFSTASSTNNTTRLPPRPRPMTPPEPPESPPIKKGPARVLSNGILHGRVGTVAGFLEAQGRRICLVTWDEGGTTFLAEDALQQPPGASKATKK